MKKSITGILIAMAAAMMFMSCSEQLNMDYASIDEIRAGTIEDKLEWYNDHLEYVNEHQSETEGWLKKYGLIN